MIRHRILIAISVFVAGFLGTLVGRRVGSQEPDLEPWAIHEACIQQRIELREALGTAILKLGMDGALGEVTRMADALESLPASDDREAIRQAALTISTINTTVIRRYLDLLSKGEMAEAYSWAHLQEQSGIDRLPVVECPEVKR